MFEKASRQKLRFESSKGDLSVEQLWEINLTALNEIAVKLHHGLENDNISFITPEQSPDSKIQLRYDIARHVIRVRLAEQQEAENARFKAAEKQKLLGFLARKKDAKLEQASEEDIIAMINAL